MPHLGSPSAAMRIQSILCMLQQPTAAGSLVLKDKGTNNKQAARKKTYGIRIFSVGLKLSSFFKYVTQRKKTYTYFDHILW